MSLTMEEKMELMMADMKAMRLENETLRKTVTALEGKVPTDADENSNINTSTDNDIENVIEKLTAS
jgi:hypothetical protein